ncbi:tetratricopeptide repeat protein [Dactylosporangium sp. NPDC050588]|uniref:tetratricopeptide repeat protein n=1 Tax=Dactylosporangium sp. NPDC050588 TaxID=3157211 RepID=UPI0033EF90A5
MNDVPGHIVLDPFAAAAWLDTTPDATDPLVVVATARNQQPAWQRLTEYYLRAAERADTAITPDRYRMPLDLAHNHAVPDELSDYRVALQWLNRERGNLVSVCLAAQRHGLDARCWQLAYTLRGYYYLAKPMCDWLTTHWAALAATRRIGDARAEASTRTNLGLAYLELGRLDAAGRQYRTAIGLAAGAGDHHGAATAQANHAWLRFSQGRFAQFLIEIAPSHAFYTQHGLRRNAAITLRGIGLAEGHLGRLDDAVTHLHEALTEFVELDLRLDTAMTLNALGDSYRQAGAMTEAAAAYRLATAAAHTCGSAYEQARGKRGLMSVTTR